MDKRFELYNDLVLELEADGELRIDIDGGCDEEGSTTWVLSDHIAKLRDFLNQLPSCANGKS